MGVPPHWLTVLNREVIACTRCPRLVEYREMVARELKALERAGLMTKRRGAFVLNNVPELMTMLHKD